MSENDEGPRFVKMIGGPEDGRVLDRHVSLSGLVGRRGPPAMLMKVVGQGGREVEYHYDGNGNYVFKGCT